MNLSTSLAFFLALGLFLGTGVPGGPEGERMDASPTEGEKARLDTVLAEGSFDGKEEIETTGTYRIGRAGEDLRLVLQKDFQTEAGPDLYVVLSPQSPDEATGDNVMNGSALRVDSLRSLAGPQTYDLPDDLELWPFASVAIQCIEYAHLYGTAGME